MIKASVIISFYNRLDYLKLVLAGFERQTFRDFEIIIADDGSNENYLDKFPIHLFIYGMKIKDLEKTKFLTGQLLLLILNI